MEVTIPLWRPFILELSQGNDLISINIGALFLSTFHSDLLCTGKVYMPGIFVQEELSPLLKFVVNGSDLFAWLIGGFGTRNYEESHEARIMGHWQMSHLMMKQVNITTTILPIICLMVLI